MIVKNKLGGIDSTLKDDTEKAKEADLITLPLGIDGTNCYNCKFIMDNKHEKGFCKHPKVAQYVNARMCCAYWDNDKTFRNYGSISSKYK